MSRVVLSARAQTDIADVVSLLAAVRPSAAPRFLAALTRTTELLADFPEIGDPLNSTRPSLAGVRRMRVRRFKRYIVVYRPIADGVEVGRVIHGSRDFERLMDELF